MDSAIPDIEIERQSKLSDTMSIWDVRSRASGSRIRNSHHNHNESDRLSFMSKSSHLSKNKTPLAFIDVNLGREKGMQKLVIYSEDEPKTVAEKFAKKHGLGESKVAKLEQMLIQRVTEYMNNKKQN